MKNLIKVIPPYIISLAVISPWIYILIVSIGSIDFTILKILLLVSFLCYSVWISSIVEYMCFESQSSKYKVASHLLTAFILLIQIVSGFLISGDAPDISIIRQTSLVSEIFILINGFIVSKIVSRVFYARTPWYLLMELIIFPIGVYTLTDDIQKWEKEKRDNIKSDK